MISFKQRHFKKEMIVMLVRCYEAFALSYRDIEELASEPSIVGLFTMRFNLLEFHGAWTIK